MSRLHAPSKETEHRPNKANEPILRRRRAKPLHPEAIQRALVDRAASKAIPNRWTWPFGWLIVFRSRTGQKVRRELPAESTYAEALIVRDREMNEHDYEMAWIIQRSAQKETR